HPSLHPAGAVGSEHLRACTDTQGMKFPYNQDIGTLWRTSTDVLTEDSVSANFRPVRSDAWRLEPLRRPHSSAGPAEVRRTPSQTCSSQNAPEVETACRV